MQQVFGQILTRSTVLELFACRQSSGHDSAQDTHVAILTSVAQCGQVLEMDSVHQMITHG